LKIVIARKDVRIEKYRASGSGGQHRNVTDSAVRLTHVPTGIVAQCCSERSQTQNLESAWGMLLSRIVRAEVDRRRGDAQERYEAKPSASYAHQRRSYVLVGKDRRVVDHLTGVTGDPDRVLRRGEIGPFLKRRA
jgi:peptide chain release factor 2